MASTVDRCHEALNTTDVTRLAGLAADRSEWVRASVPLNPAAPRALLRAGLADPSWRVVSAIAARMASNARFWDDADPLSDEVSGWLAFCGDLVEVRALGLARHLNVAVREPLASNTAWLSVQVQLSRDPARHVRAALAGSVFLLPQVRSVLTTDPVPDVRDLARRRWEGEPRGISPDPEDVTEDDLEADLLINPRFGPAAAAQHDAVRRHERASEATRQRILVQQSSMPWPTDQDVVIDLPELHRVMIRTDVQSRPAWLADTDAVLEQVASVLAGLGGLLEDDPWELDGQLVISAEVPRPVTASQVARAVTVATSVAFKP